MINILLIDQYTGWKIQEGVPYVCIKSHGAFRKYKKLTKSDSIKK